MYVTILKNILSLRKYTLAQQIGKCYNKNNIKQQRRTSVGALDIFRPQNYQPEISWFKKFPNGT